MMKTAFQNGDIINSRNIVDKLCSYCLVLIVINNVTDLISPITILKNEPP